MTTKEALDYLNKAAQTNAATNKSKTRNNNNKNKNKRLHEEVIFNKLTPENVSHTIEFNDKINLRIDNVSDGNARVGSKPIPCTEIVATTINKNTNEPQYTIKAVIEKDSKDKILRADIKEDNTDISTRVNITNKELVSAIEKLAFTK